MADVPVSDSYRLVFIVYNTLYNPADAGRPGPLLRERRAASDRRRAVPGRGDGA